MPRYPALFVLFILNLVHALGLPAPAQDEWPAIFNPFKVETIHIQIDPQKWDAIKRDTNFYDPVLNIREPCLMWMEGPNPPNSAATAITVQIRRKSDPALPDEGNPQKVSLKIDVNEYVEGQSIRGLKKISLENGSGNGVLKEGFAMNMHRLAAEAGFYPTNAFYAAWVRLVVNGQYVGLYTSPEQRDKAFLRNRGMYRERASWLYEVNGGLFLDSSVATTDSPTHNHLNYLPFRAPNSPPANFEADAQAWVDVHSMLTMAAIEAWMANTDGLFTKSASDQGKNSFCADWLPSLQHRRLYLPWDLDGGFSNTTWNIFSGGSGQANSRQYQRQFLDHYWFGQVYRQLFTELLDGPLSTTSLNAWLDQLEPVLGPALAEDPNADGGSFASLRSFIAARNTNVRTQIGSIVKPPIWSLNGGEVAVGQTISLSHQNTAGATTIYYTTDGTDPRATGGAPSATAIAYTSALTINGPAQFAARARNVNGATTNWSNIRRATFEVAAALDSLRITELMHRPLGDAAFEDADEFEFIELKNTGAAPLQIGGCKLDGLDFTFAPGTVVPAGAYVVLVANPTAFSSRYPAVPIHGVFFKNLNNSGERIRVLTPEGAAVDEVEYDANPPWPLGPDGLGYSLNRIGPGEDATNWRASAAIHGSPGADDPVPPYAPGLIINEVIAKSNTPLEDAIEIHNPTATPIDISGWWLSDSYDPADPARATLKKYRVPAGTIVPAGGYRVFYEVDFNPAAPTAAAIVPFGLGQGGDAVYLSSADAAGNLTGHICGQRFGASDDGVSQGRIPTSTGFDFGHLVSHSFGVSAPASKTDFRGGSGAPNSGPRVGPVVISEIMYAPRAGSAEFIELTNVSAAPVLLEGWTLEGAGGFAFPAGATVAPGGRVLLVDTASFTVSAFAAAHNVPGDVALFGALFDLGDGGESIELLRPNPTAGNPPLRVDRAQYNDKAPWPTAATAGASLERVDLSMFGNEPLNWTSSAINGTPGRARNSNTHLAIAAGDRWKFHARNRSLGTAWRNVTYRDGGWDSGTAPLGAGLPGLATAIPYGPTKPVTTFLRKEFAVSAPVPTISTVTLRVNYNDGFIAFLNGQEVARRSLPTTAVDYDTPASAHPAGTFESIDLTQYRNLLQPGKNSLAIELHLTGSADPDAYFDADLAYSISESAPSDTDMDGMPDTWETARGLNPNDGADAAMDADEDGQSNLAEYLAGTDPHLATSAFRISEIERVPEGMRIRVSTVAGKRYQLEVSEDLRSWEKLGAAVTAAGNLLEITESPLQPAPRFYRAQLVVSP